MRCKDLVKKPVEICRETDTVQEAARRMAEVGIGFLPICDQNGRLVGALTDRDIAIRLAAIDRAASATRVGEIMTREVVACEPSDDITVAERLMAEHQKSRVILVAGQHVAGVISLSDLAAMRDPQALPVLRAVAAREVPQGAGQRRRGAMP
jgi:CBS domain-containing protein